MKTSEVMSSIRAALPNLTPIEEDIVRSRVDSYHLPVKFVKVFEYSSESSNPEERYDEVYESLRVQFPTASSYQVFNSFELFELENDKIIIAVQLGDL